MTYEEARDVLQKTSLYECMEICVERNCDSCETSIAMETAYEALEKQMEYTWHNASEELPNDGEEVIVKGHGRDYIFPKQGETLKEAVERISKEEWKRIAFYSEEYKCWCGYFGMPLNPQPEEWKPIDWS